MKLLRRFLVICLVLVGSGLAFQMLYAVPDTSTLDHSEAIPASENTTLGAAVASAARANPGKSGVTPLADGHLAFAARLHLIQAAEESIDVRYYIWQKDLTGLLLLEGLRDAADRGVRVRMLLDDNGTPDLDAELAEMAAHPNIEIRLFNPFILRNPRMLSYVLDFSRVNRRMHNKSLTIDGVVSVVGGRNIGDIYFSRSLGTNYFDLDVVALGPAAQDVAADFDLYWKSQSSIPVELVLPERQADEGALDASVARMRALPGGEDYSQAVADLELMSLILDDTRGFEWVEMKLVSDDPVKGVGKAQSDELMIIRLLDMVPRPEKEISLVSAYFVPGDRLTDMLAEWAQAGVLVRTVTNAQEATDVLPVHAGYRRYRDRLVDAGVQVFELKSTLEKPDVLEQFGLVGSGTTSLHAKTFVIDRERAFVGSFNFDPRSARLNTEMGFLIESPKVATEMSEGFETGIPLWTYAVSRGSDGSLIWREIATDGGEVTYEAEPKTTVFTRFLVQIIALLPIQWML
ncbi:phospholipase D family protein [Ruegeria marina]|uniref:Phospholipase D n=1 Tax=Ruegeria marina TaxID=639004 RepID=A0A1G6QLB4_9RHOB|nr:phospholipase D family protein [Ruegeria marina]SDC93088.1 Phosphatidylserine/phosphatidylglycerophosphate/cardiolipin synthase [Ruegeria marina]